MIKINIISYSIFLQHHLKANFDIDAKTAILQDYLSGEILLKRAR